MTTSMIFLNQLAFSFSANCISNMKKIEYSSCMRKFDEPNAVDYRYISDKSCVALFFFFKVQTI